MILEQKSSMVEEAVEDIISLALGKNIIAQKKNYLEKIDFAKSRFFQAGTKNKP